MMSCNSEKKANSEKSNKESESTSKTIDISEEKSIENTTWIISTMEGKDMSQSETKGKDVHFILHTEGLRVSGYSGCNTFTGTYTLEDGNRISFSKMASTRMMCPDSKINESQLLGIFELADNYTLNDGKLSLNKAKRAPLAVFKKGEQNSEPIVEKYWKLKTFGGKNVTMADHQEREIYFTLKAKDNKIVGFSGCNNIGGEYTLEKGNRIRFTKMLTTLKACPDVDVNETEFLKVFELADNYTIKDDVLSLNVGRRAPLAVFEAVYMQ